MLDGDDPEDKPSGYFFSPTQKKHNKVLVSQKI
jgi:hypothetical protein